MRDLGETEIQQLNTALGNENIPGLEVSMRNALAVGRVQSIENLAGIIERLSKRQRTLQGCPFDIFHDEVFWPDVVQRADVRVIQRGHRARLPLEPFRKPLAGNFNSDDTV